MKLIDIIGIAVSTFVNNKMRTLLTIFGISIGISAIVFLVSIGFGLQSITIGEIQSIKALKTYNVTSGDSKILAMDDTTIEKFKKITNVASVNPSLAVSGQIAYNGSKTDVLANLATVEYIDLESPRLDVGESFREDSGDRINVTSVVADAFSMKPSELIGKEVTLSAYILNPDNPKVPLTQQKRFVVSGVIKDSTASYVYAPIKQFTIPPKTQYSVIKVKVNDSADMAKIKGIITADGYKASSIGEKIDQMNRIFNIAQIVLLVLGAIAMVVASIGMFNTLTISLLERTKDIGVMKALGATDRAIYLIFLSEAASISLAGGLSGVLIAMVSGNVINIAVSSLAVRAGGEPVHPFQAPLAFIGIILGFSLLVGILTGLYPARRAAGLNPLDALRYE